MFIRHPLHAGREAQRCFELLDGAGVPVEKLKYFDGQPLSLAMHFEAIAAMRTDA